MKIKRSEKIARNYRSTYLAKEYRQLIDSGQARSEADLARQLGISRVRVNHFVSLLKLAPEVIQAIEKIGDPMPRKLVTERKLMFLARTGFLREAEVDFVLMLC